MCQEHLPNSKVVPEGCVKRIYQILKESFTRFTISLKIILECQQQFTHLSCLKMFPEDNKHLTYQNKVPEGFAYLIQTVFHIFVSKSITSFNLGFRRLYWSCLKGFQKVVSEISSGKTKGSKTLCHNHLLDLIRVSEDHAKSNYHI